MNLLVDTTVQCPHCGESWSLRVDTSLGAYSTVEDCTVCCRPIEFSFECEPGEVFAAEGRPA